MIARNPAEGQQQRSRTPAGWAGRVAVLAVSGWLAACAAAWALQEQLVFRPSAVLRADPGRYGMPFEDVTAVAADGVRLHGWYLAPTAAGGVHVLFLHGNAGNVSHRLDTLRTLQALGHGVLIVDYRGYGLSEGRPSEAGTYLDAEAGWRHLVESRGVAPRDIVIYGRSLGGAVATALAASVAPRGVVLESTFTRLADLARVHYRLLPTDWLLRIHYDSLARMPRLDAPVLVAHSPDDEIVPYALGRELAAAAPRLAAFVELTGSHNQAFRRSGPAWHQRVDRFLREGR